jgi:capsular exopolysaccharide synthesis family protein
VLQRRVAGESGVSSISGRISASSIENTNLFTLSVEDRDPEKAHQILQAVVNNYPSLSESIIGKVNMKVLDETGVPTVPSNSRDLSEHVQKGAIAGCALGLLWVLAVTLLRKTIRREEDCIKYVNQKCLGGVPYIHVKERSKNMEVRLNILDEKIEPEFNEAIRLIRNKVERSAKEHNLKTILVTSTMPGEGKSTIAVNMALSLAQEGKRVVLMDADLRNPSDSEILNFESELGLIDFLKGDINPKDCMYNASRIGIDKSIPFFFIPGGKAIEDGDNYLGNRRMKLIIESLQDHVDYLILDSAPVGLLTDASLIAQYADGVVFIIKKDYVKTDDILRGMEHLAEGKIHMIGCVLNGE